MLLKINNKELYFDYLSSLPVAIAVADVETHLLMHFNSQAEGLWQRSYEDVINQPQSILHSDYWNQKSVETFTKHVSELEAGGEIRSSANAALRPDGSEIPIEITANMIEIEGRKALVGIFISVQKREETKEKLTRQEDELRAIFENSQIGIMHLKSGRILANANQRLADILGYKNPQEMVGISMEQLHLSHERFVWFGKHHYEALRQRDSTHIHYQIRKKNGDAVWIALSGKAVDRNIPADLDKGVIWIIDDISDYKSLEISLKKENTLSKNLYKELQHEHDYLQAIIDGVTDPIMVIREDYSIELMNVDLRQTIEHSDFVFDNREYPKCYEVSHHRHTPCDGADHPCPLKEVLENAQETKVVHAHQDMQGDDRFVELAATPLVDDSGRCVGIIEFARDITQHLQTLNELDYQAHHDALTGLPNRVLYHDRLEQSILKSKRSGEKLALFFLDLDHFKQINDSLGHAIGDRVLLETTQRLQEHIRAEDTLARLGGDEFTILLEGVTKPQDASPLAQKILNLFTEPFAIDGHNLYLSCSIGISLYPDDSQDPDDLLKFADNAMYKAKDEGRNNFQFYTKEMTEIAFERIVLEASLRQAIANDEFVLYYQPQFHVKTKDIIGMEALIRWEHPSLGLVAPSRFIPLAEETGFIIEIDNWVMRTAMSQVAAWHKEGLHVGILSLNLAIKQLESSSFLATLERTLEETQFQAQWLKLEVLERDIMRKPQESILKLEKIRKLGITLTIDDFGTGQSSLTYLKRFPIDQLKIDQSFVRDINKESEDNAIVLAIIALAEALNLHTIAEGVETQEQLDFLLEHGCENIQGYFFSRPLDVQKMHHLLIK